jgi:diacylglycerol kinase
MLEKPSKLRIALISGAVIGAVSSVPGISLINCCCCAGVWLGGVLALYLYKQQLTEEMPPLESSDALMLGLMAGVIGAFTATVINVLILVTFGPVEAELVKSIVEKVLDRMAEQGSMTPDMIDMLRGQIDQSIKDAGRASSIFGGLFVALIVYPIFTILGALLGFAIFRPKMPPQTTATP